MSDFFRPLPLSDELSSLLKKGFNFEFVDNLVFHSDEVYKSMMESTRMMRLAENFDPLPDPDAIDFIHVSTWKGIGLASRQTVKRGTDICVCYGEVFENGTQPDESDYCLQTPGGHIIYFKNKSGINRFVQSSCVANCMWEPRWRNGLCFLVLVAMEDIPGYTPFVFESTQMLGYGKKRFICRCEQGRKCRRMVAAVRPKIKFYCDKCRIQFENKHQLYEHRLIFHYYKGAIPCDFCCLTFSSLVAYYRHCLYCDTGNHKRVMSVTFRCRTCNQLCRGPKGYMDHVDECLNQDGNVEEVDDDPDSSHGDSPSIPPDSNLPMGLENICAPCLPPVRPDFDVDAAVDSILQRLEQEPRVRYESPEHDVYLIESCSPSIQKNVSLSRKTTPPKKKSPQQGALRQITPPPMNLRNAGMNIRIEEPMNFFGSGRTAEEFCGRSMNVERRQSPSPVPLPQELQLMLDSGNYNVSLISSSPSSGRGQEETSTFGAACNRQQSPRSTRGDSQSIHPETAASPKTNSSQSSSKSHSSKLPSFSQASSSGTAKIRSSPPECKAPTIKSSPKSKMPSFNSSDYSDTVPLRSPTTNSPNHRAPCGRRFVTPPRDLQRTSEECDQNSSIVMPDLDTSFYEDDATFQNRMQQFLQSMPARISPNQQRTRAMSVPPQAPVYSPQSTGRGEAGSSQRSPLASVPAASPHSSSGKNAGSRLPARPTQATRGVSPTWPYGWDLSPIYCTEGIPKDLDFSNIQVPFHTTPSPHDDLTFPFRMDNFFLNIGGAVVPNRNPESPNHATLGSTPPSSPTSPDKSIFPPIRDDNVFSDPDLMSFLQQIPRCPGSESPPRDPLYSVRTPRNIVLPGPDRPDKYYDDIKKWPKWTKLSDYFDSKKKEFYSEKGLRKIQRKLVLAEIRPASEPSRRVLRSVTADTSRQEEVIMPQPEGSRQVPERSQISGNRRRIVSEPSRRVLRSVTADTSRQEEVIMPQAEGSRQVAGSSRDENVSIQDRSKRILSASSVSSEEKQSSQNRQAQPPETLNSRRAPKKTIEPSERVLRSRTAGTSRQEEVVPQAEGSDQLPGTSQQSGNNRRVLVEPSTRGMRSRSTATSSNEIISQGSQKNKDQAQGSRPLPGSSRDRDASVQDRSKRKLSASSVSSSGENKSTQLPPAGKSQQTSKSKRGQKKTAEPTGRVLRSQTNPTTDFLSLSTMQKPAKKRSKTKDTRGQVDQVVEISPEPMPPKSPESESSFISIPETNMPIIPRGRTGARAGAARPHESPEEMDTAEDGNNKEKEKKTKKKGSKK